MTNTLIEKKRVYREYQYRLGKQYIVPILKEWQIPIVDLFVLDIGCAEGGVLCALADEDARSLGFDKQITKDMEESNQTKLFITFPPFYAPFGGHQQLLKSVLRFVPYFHAMPTPIWAVFRWWIKHFDGNANFVKEMDKLRMHRTTIRGFRKLAKQHGYKIIAEKFYLSRPSYHLRYGWPVISSKILSRIPVLCEFVISGAFFALTREN